MFSLERFTEKTLRKDNFGRFLGQKRLKNDEKWLNFAYHFLNDPERRACGDFLLFDGHFVLANLNP